jgi:hypothetical protein
MLEMNVILSGERPVTMRLIQAGLVTALLVMTACTSEGAGETTEPPTTSTPTTESTATPEPTTTLGTTFVVKEPGDSGPGITATTPDSGWTLSTDVGGVFKGDVDAAVGEAAVFLWSFPAGTEFYVPADPCQSESSMPTSPATTADEISSALAAQASRDGSEPVEVTIGGYEGKSLTVHVPDDVVFADCEGETFLTYATGDDPGARTQQGPGQIDEIWILDVDGSIVIISAVYRPDTPTEFVEEMQSIAQSATFQLAS